MKFATWFAAASIVCSLPGQSAFAGPRPRPEKAARPKTGPRIVRHFAATANAPGRVINFSPAFYSDVRDAATKLLRKHPPDKYFYVAIGTNYGAIAAFLNVLGAAEPGDGADQQSDIVASLPAEGFNSADFAARLPADVRANKRKIVLLYSKTIQLAPRILRQGFPGLQFVDLDPELRLELSHGAYTGFQEHAYTSMVKNPEHLRARAGMLEMMREDQTLDNVLGELELEAEFSTTSIAPNPVEARLKRLADAPVTPAEVRPAVETTGPRSLSAGLTPQITTSEAEASIRPLRPKPHHEPFVHTPEPLPPGLDAPVKKLIQQTNRPTVKEVMALAKRAKLGLSAGKNPFGEASHITNNIEGMADMIAQLEHAYPGATYMPMGRDAVAIADILDGFYSSLGQQGRVRRLDISGLSFPHYRNATALTKDEDAPVLYGFLKDSGVDLDQLDGKPPTVLIDVTSYNPTSQSTQLMHALHRTWAGKGRDPKDLAKKVAFVGLPMMGGGNFRISSNPDGESMERTKERLAEMTTATGPKDILYLGGSLGGLTYTAFWHSDFTRLEQQDGQWVAPPGRQESEFSKRRVLAELFEIGRTVSTPDFFEKVKTKAHKQYGYEFSAKRSESPKRFAAVKAAPKPTTVAAESTLLTAIRSRMAQHSMWERSSVAGDFLEDMAGMMSRGTFSQKDLNEAVSELYKHVNLRSPTVKSRVKSINSLHPGFKASFRMARRAAEESSLGNH